MNNKQLFLISSFLILTFILSGCGTGNPYAAGSFLRGQHFDDNGNNREAAEAYGSFVRMSPTDSLACEAQYNKALCYIELKEFPLAVVELQILRKEYPTSDFVGDSWFMEAEAQYLQANGPEIDISPAVAARELYIQFLDLFPDNSSVPIAQNRLIEISDLVVQKRLFMVKTYMQLRQYDAAMIVLERVLVDEPDSQLLDEVMKMKDMVEAKQPKTED
ncbi:tetratricopeptide repeat protein [bacterium]|jgi:outer membrane protein assembly factor BamD (BamD/ComL family)|nr:tetratricopeptide repeat protein [bacterium]MBT7311696.1 tetratricopeptide repeat protein [bacterium]